MKNNLNITQQDLDDDQAAWCCFLGTSQILDEIDRRNGKSRPKSDAMTSYSFYMLDMSDDVKIALQKVKSSLHKNDKKNL